MIMVGLLVVLVYWLSWLVLGEEQFDDKDDKEMESLPTVPSLFPIFSLLL
jgi:hypothetical protein